MLRRHVFLDAFFWFAFVCANSNVFELSRMYIAGINEEILLKGYYKALNQSNTTLSVTWFKDNARLQAGSRPGLIFQNGGNELKINKAKMKDQGNYRCIVQLSDNSTFITNFHVIVHKDPLPNWAVAVIIVGLILFLIGTAIFFQCRRKLFEMVLSKKPRRRHKTNSEASTKE